VLGWLLVVLSFVAALATAAAQLPWASGQLTSSRVDEFNAGDLVNRAPGALPFAVLASSVGLLAAAWFGAAALPARRAGRLVVTAVVAAALVLVVVGVGTFDADERGEALGLLLVLVVLPSAVLLGLTWLGARRGAAWAAVALSSVAVLGAGYVLLNLVSGLADVEVGAWAALLLAVVGLVGAVLLLRSLPPRPRPLEPGDPGWTA
jgi:hypothetical protein